MESVDPPLSTISYMCRVNKKGLQSVWSIHLQKLIIIVIIVIVQINDSFRHISEKLVQIFLYR